MNDERREFIRYQVKPHMIFLYSNYSHVQGWVKDISKGGMAFEYIADGKCEPKPDIRIILIGDAFPFYLSDLFCKTIYDVEVNKNYRQLTGSGIHRCGVQYYKLDPQVLEKVEFLLSSESILPDA